MIATTVSISSQNDPPHILRMLFLLPVLLVASLASADQMPAQWLGKYKLYKVMMIIFVMQASTSLRPARASPPSCPRLGWTGSQDRQAFDFLVLTICKQTFCQSRLLVPSTQLPQTRTWEGTEWGSTPRPRSSRPPSSSSSECLSMRPLVMELKWGLQQLWVETLWSRTRYTLIREPSVIFLSLNCLINHLQRATKSSGVSRIETRNFKNNGQIMELVHTIPGKANIRSVRVYKKL